MTFMPLRLPLIAFFAAALAAGALSGCGTSDDKMASFLVAPGKYVLYDCVDIARETKGTMARQKELQQLMAKAGTDTTGRLIGEATYGTDLATTRGQMRDLRAAAAERKCDFVPGADSAPAANPKIH
jgi:hypothetical protein